MAESTPAGSISSFFQSACLFLARASGVALGVVDQANLRGEELRQFARRFRDRRDPSTAISKKRAASATGAGRDLVVSALAIGHQFQRAHTACGRDRSAPRSGRSRRNRLRAVIVSASPESQLAGVCARPCGQPAATPVSRELALGLLRLVEIHTVGTWAMMNRTYRVRAKRVWAERRTSAFLQERFHHSSSERLAGESSGMVQSAHHRHRAAHVGHRAE